jgi:hypothetical protein
MARTKKPQRQATTVGLAKLAEQLRYEWRERQRPAAESKGAELHSSRRAGADLGDEGGC